ncbi:lamin tail domain-containing protein, partial [Flavihumibacter cheonanensis]|uniref:lamin tail domain-containing protein n=1 Tax=Flavihumibacter cheonanensis TaxID=1442385 RepID=UPI001EF7FAF2
LYNAGTNLVNLLGWCLTDDAGNPSQWRFPNTNLPPGRFLVVFASNKDRRIPGAPLHTNFRLAAEGEFLALLRPDGLTVASQFAPQFPPQSANV